MSRTPYTAGDREDLLADLNPAQREAVLHGGGPLLVVAGAGTGKTRVLTRRAAWLVAGGLPSRAVLAITFTNKAADVLKDRLAGLIPGPPVQAGTFHAFSAGVLRRHGEAIGIEGDFTVIDRDDQRRLMREILHGKGPDGDGGRCAAAVVEWISQRKNGGAGEPPDRIPAHLQEALPAIEAAYDERRRAGNLLDFDDLLLQALCLLRDVEDVGTRYRERFAHVLVDEYQDTNLAQADLLRALLPPSRNLMVVGDPDQSIYRWRGAAVKNILEFEREYPGARKIVLEENYRSTGRILEAAERVIARNVGRHAKHLRTVNPPGERLLEVRCRDPEDEAEVVAGLVEGWRREGFAPGDLAVFYRVNSLSRALEMALRGRQIPYVVVAGVEFFQRREVKDLLAYARLVTNPRDEAAFLRIANVPRRGVGDQGLRALRAEAVRRGVSLPELAGDPPPGVGARARGGLSSLRGILGEARARPASPVGPFLDWLAERSGYRAWLEAQEEDVELSRRENLDELITYAHAFDARGVEGTLTAFLEETALVSDQDAVPGGDGPVSLMSVHAAKGLEFEGVVIVGAEEDLFPHARSQGDAAALEEERRLFYVAMTRARKRLAVTHVAWRHGWRGEGPRRRSPYLADVPDALVERKDRARERPAPESASRRADPFLDEADEFPDAVREVEASYAAGDRVRHPYFGEGWLADCRGRGAEARVVVDFDRFGRKDLMLRHANLSRIDP